MGLKTLSLFASHVWTGTHQGLNFGAKIPSVYCLIRVHKVAIIASGQDINFKKGEGVEDTVKCVLGKGACVVVGDKRCKSSIDEDEEEEEEEEYGVRKRVGKGDDGGRSGSNRKKDSRGRRTRSSV